MICSCRTTEVLDDELSSSRVVTSYSSRKIFAKKESNRIRIASYTQRPRQTNLNLDLAQNLTLNKPKKIRYDAYGKIISKDKKKQKVTFIDIIDKKTKFAEIIEEDDNNYNNSIKRKLSLKSLTSPRIRRSQSENFDNKVTCNACLIM